MKSEFEESVEKIARVRGLTKERVIQIFAEISKERGDTESLKELRAMKGKRTRMRAGRRKSKYVKCKVPEKK